MNLDVIDQYDKRITTARKERLASTDPLPKEEKESLGVLGYVGDAAKGIFDGGLDALEEVNEMGYKALNWLDNTSGAKVLDDDYTRVIPDLDLESSAGKMASGVTKFTIGMLGAGKVLKGAKLLQGATKGAKIAHSLVQGAMADFSMTDPGEDRLSDLIEQFPALGNPITKYLSAEEDEGYWEGKLKATAEGMLVSGMTDVFLKSMKVFKKAQVAGKKGGAKAAQAVLDEEQPALFEDLSKAVDPTGLRFVSKVDGHIGTIVDMTDDGAYKVAIKGKGKDVTEEILAKDQMSVIPKSHLMSDKDIFQKIGGKSLDTDAPPMKTLDQITTEREYFQTENLGKIKEAVNKALDDPEWAKEGRLDYSAINLDYFDTTEGASKVLRAYEEASEEALRARVGSENFGDIAIKGINYMNEVLDDPTGFIRDIADLGDDSLAMAGKANGVGNLIAQISDDISNISKELLDPTKATPALKLKLVHRLELLDESMQHYKAIKTGVARTLNSFKAPMSFYDATTMDNVQQIIDTYGGDALIDKLASRMANMRPKDAAKLLYKTRADKFWALNNELWINNVLSGLKTQVVNTTSTALNATMYPLSKMAGGLVTKDKALIMEGARMYYAYGKFLTENVTMMAKAFKYGTNMLDSGSTVFDAPAQAWRHETFDIKYQPLAKIVDGFGAVINLPGRSLMATDEFFKHMVYRGELYSTLFDKGIKMGLEGKALEGYVEQGLDKAFSLVKLPGGEQVLGKAVFKDALDVAEEVTFTTTLPKGSLGKHLQQITSAHPSLRMVLPFIKTPTNILRTAGQYTPGIANIMPSFREAIEAGGKKKAIAMGKLSVGAGLWGTGLILASSGKLTGGGSKDPRILAMDKEAGWQPYSFVTTDENGKKHYTSFSRIDPFASFFGMCADMHEIAGEIDDATMGDIATSFCIALTQNLTSKTYLRGLSETLDFLTNPEEKAHTFLKRQSAAYVPLSSLLNDVTRATNPEMKEAWGVVEHIKSRIPGLSATVPPKKSWVTGQSMRVPEGIGLDFASPFATSEVTGEVQQELARLDYGFSPPAKDLGGVDLNEKQYSRLCELHGTVKIGGKTMLQALEQTMKSSRYDIKRERIDDSKRPDDMIDHRINMIKQVISRYRMAAVRELKREDPALSQATRDFRKGKQSWKSGNTSGIEAFGQIAELSQ